MKHEGQGIQHWEISEPQHGKRLDQVLTDVSGLTRVRIQSLISDGHVWKDGAQSVKLKRSTRVILGEVYQMCVPEPKALTLTPENIALDILFEDEYLIVVNKPAGMVVHPSHGHDTGTLVHALLYHCDSLPGINGVERPGIVHRLDKDTSGSLVVAKTEAAHQGLSALFASHDLQREYVAWCRGFPHWIEKRIELPIGRHPHHRQKMAVSPKGKIAITDAKLEKRYDDNFCRIRLRLHTGRTHQIRVHLSHENVPVLADALYGRKFNPSKHIPEPAFGILTQLSRQALHAQVLGFKHPITHEDIHCVAPFPEELKALDEALVVLG
ncbi:MAG TPA: RluA family pseudouridine synthase [Mariprofundaceae bacterium]|nr:RluA family pseudouridine synthase [Mariprofundaceae bacterium]